MTRKQFAVIAARINEELLNISRLQNELKEKGFSGSPRAVKLAVAQADSFAIRGIGSVLHDFYVAIENVFEVIARDIDERLPSGENWHQELLRQMGVPARVPEDYFDCDLDAVIRPLRFDCRRIEGYFAGLCW